MRANLRCALLLLGTTACTAGEQAKRPSRDTPLAQATQPVLVADSARAPTMPADTVLRADAKGHLIVPLTFVRTCEGEECTQEFAALACFATVLHLAPAETAAVVSRVARGDTVEVTRRDLRVMRPGLVVFRRPFRLENDLGGDEPSPRSDTLRFAAGDTLYLVRYLELGDWAWWHDGKLDSSYEFWAGEFGEGLGGSSPVTDTSTAVRVSHPVSEDWWLVTPQAGASGWWLADTLGSLRSIRTMEHWDEHCPAVRSSGAR